MQEIKISTWIKQMQKAGNNTDTICTIIGVTPNMVSRYRRGLNTPSLSVATEVFIYTGMQVVIHPYSLKALKEAVDEI